MKKKLLALLSALALCVGLMVPASAAGQTFTARRNPVRDGRRFVPGHQRHHL